MRSAHHNPHAIAIATCQVHVYLPRARAQRRIEGIPTAEYSGSKDLAKMRMEVCGRVLTNKIAGTF